MPNPNSTARKTRPRPPRRHHRRPGAVRPRGRRVRGRSGWRAADRAGEGESEGFESWPSRSSTEHAVNGDLHAARRSAGRRLRRGRRCTRRRVGGADLRAEAPVGRLRDRPGRQRSSVRSRRRCSDLRSSRETCICETPTRSAISVWVRSAPKRRNRICRSRSGRCWAAAKIVAWSSTSSRRSSCVSDRLQPAHRAVVVDRARGVERQRVVGLGGLQAVEHLLARSAPGTRPAR